MGSGCDAGSHFQDERRHPQINQKRDAALETIGYAQNGNDITLTATKTLPNAFFGKPLILTAGLRESQGADLGFLGFANQYHTSFKGSIAILPFERWLFAYEFRQKRSPYGRYAQ